MTRHYLIHGLVVTSGDELRMASLTPLDIEPGAPDVTFTVELDRPLSPELSRSWADDTDERWVVAHWVNGTVVVEFPGLALFEVRQDAVSMLRRATDDDVLLEHMLLDEVLPLLVSLRGDLMLHAAGAVAASGRAHLFLGETGAGKSTLATALAAQGWPLLDDDAIRVTERPEGLLATPGYAGARLLPASTKGLRLELGAGTPMGHGHPKRRYTFEGSQLRMAERPAVIGGLYLIERRDQDRPSMQPLGFAAAFGWLVEHGWHLADEPTEIAKNAFERASRLAEAVPSWHLIIPASFTALTETIALLAESDAAFPGQVSSPRQIHT